MDPITASEMLEEFRLMEGTLFQDEEAKLFYLDVKGVVLDSLVAAWDKFSASDVLFQTALDRYYAWEGAVGHEEVERCMSDVNNVCERHFHVAVFYSRQLYGNEDFNQKIVIVTGGASGFGAAIAQRMAMAGASVMVADLNATGAQAIAEKIRAAGGKASSIAADVSDCASFKNMVTSTRKELGSLDILVNNAGTTHRNKPALQVTEEEFDRVYKVNVKSLFWAAQTVLPIFVQQGGGCIVNVASTTGVRPGPGLSWYSGSKAAMINITKGLALEFAKSGVRINAVNPMIGETAMLGDFMGMEDTPENRERFLMRIPLGRFTRPADVASAVTFLASDEASYLTGVCLDVDGGRNI